MARAIVLGAGMVGSVMAADLAADGEINVTIADVSGAALRRAVERACGKVSAVEVDLSDAAAVRRLVEPFDLVLGALASRIGFQTLRVVIEAGKNYCDISFMPEDALALDELAKARGVTAIVDCGVAPGMSNMLAGYAVTQLEECSEIAIYVGGLPRERRWPFQYKAAFSPADVIEEYTRPARLVEHGEIVVREALSEPELIDFPGMGTLEAFNTDGLRSLAYTLRVPCMKEKTLRYPGHIELMRAFRETGLFSKEPVAVGQTTVRPLDVTSALLFPKWSYQPGEEDVTVMRVTARGRSAGKAASLAWDLFDAYDHTARTTSMARTTAFPCTSMARLVLEGRIHSRGVIPPERLGQEAGLLDAVLEQLAARGVCFQQSRSSG